MKPVPLPLRACTTQPESIPINEEGYIKVSEIRIAKSNESTNGRAYSFGAHSHFMAPEVLQNQVREIG